MSGLSVSFLLFAGEVFPDVLTSFFYLSSLLSGISLTYPEYWLAPTLGFLLNFESSESMTKLLYLYPIARFFLVGES